MANFNFDPSLHVVNPTYIPPSINPIPLDPVISNASVMQSIGEYHSRLDALSDWDVDGPVQVRTINPGSRFRSAFLRDPLSTEDFTTNVSTSTVTSSTRASEASTGTSTISSAPYLSSGPTSISIGATADRFLYQTNGEVEWRTVQAASNPHTNPVTFSTKVEGETLQLRASLKGGEFRIESESDLRQWESWLRDQRAQIMQKMYEETGDAKYLVENILL